uniref:SKA complex subunit 1 n=1 Tax=Amphilophus citrinellus TaxID=61819 RepID=A0A3Q0RG87_AMPCI
MNECWLFSFHHIHDRISSIKHTLDLSVVELPQNKIAKLGQELFALERLLEEFEKSVGQQKDHLKHLKVKLQPPQFTALTSYSLILPSRNEPAVKQKEADVQPAEKKSSKSFVREMEFITLPEFESIPQYMKGRVTYDQLNAAVDGINTAVTAKYKIIHQSVRALNNHARKLHQRFKDQETKDTKGQYFVVEDDIREFTQMKVDKRFQGILNMLRHCQRLRELRGGGLTRYVLL